MSQEEDLSDQLDAIRVLHDRLTREKDLLRDYVGLEPAARVLDGGPGWLHITCGSGKVRISAVTREEMDSYARERVAAALAVQDRQPIRVNQRQPKLAERVMVFRGGVGVPFTPVWFEGYFIGWQDGLATASVNGELTLFTHWLPALPIPADLT